MTQLPKFTAALLHPRYWLTWSGIGLLWLIVQLPYPVIFRMGKGLGRIAQQFMKRRARIAYRNLELCFPQMSESERHDMVVKNFESVGMGLMETGMAWFWSDKRVYRPNDNPVIDLIQTNGRMRSNKSMIDRKDLKGMIRALKSGEVVWYAPDHDYGPQSSVFVPFFAVEEAATTTGTWMLARMSKAAIVPFVPRRKPDGSGYQLIMLEPELTPPQKPPRAG